MHPYTYTASVHHSQHQSQHQRMMQRQYTYNNTYMHTYIHAYMHTLRLHNVHEDDVNERKQCAHVDDGHQGADGDHPGTPGGMEHAHSLTL